MDLLSSTLGGVLVQSLLLVTTSSGDVTADTETSYPGGTRGNWSKSDEESMLKATSTTSLPHTAKSVEQTSTNTSSTTLRPSAVGYDYGCDDISAAELDLLLYMNNIRAGLGKSPLKIGKYAQRTAKLKVHDDAWGTKYGESLSCSYKGGSMHHWAASTMTSAYPTCCFRPDYDNLAEGGPGCMHYAVQNASRGHLTSAISFEIAAGFDLHPCYDEGFPPIQELYDSERLTNAWLASPSHAPLITGEGYWDMEWTSVGVAVGPCRAAVWFMLWDDKEVMCPAYISHSSSTSYWWDAYPMTGGHFIDLEVIGGGPAIPRLTIEDDSILVHFQGLGDDVSLGTP